MKRLFYISILWMFYPCNLLSQIDTITPKWSEEIRNEIFTLKRDSLNISKTYWDKKYNLFKQFWNTFFNEEQIQMGSILLNHLHYTYLHIDTVFYIEWLNKINFYENFKILLTKYIEDDIIEQNRQYYAQRFDTIAVIFWREGQKIELHDNFKIFFIVQKNDKESQCVQAEIINDSFIVPYLGTDTTGIVMLEYQQNYYPVYDGRNFVSGGKNYYRNLYNIRSSEKIKIIFDIQPYHFGKRPDDGKWQEFEDEYQDCHAGDATIMQKKYKNSIGFYSIRRSRSQVYSLEPIYSTKDFFKKSKKIMTKSKKSKSIINVLPLF